MESLARRGLISFSRQPNKQKIRITRQFYKRTFDIGNYYQLNDAFKFESSIDELNQYINSGN